MESEEMDDMR